MCEMQKLVDWIIGKGLSSDSIDEILKGVAQALLRLGYP